MVEADGLCPRPPYLFHVLSSQTKQISNTCKDPRMAMILKNVALGSLILMTGFAATQVWKDLVESQDRERSR